MVNSSRRALVYVASWNSLSVSSVPSTWTETLHCTQRLKHTTCSFYIVSQNTVLGENSAPILPHAILFLLFKKYGKVWPIAYYQNQGKDNCLQVSSLLKADHPRTLLGGNKPFCKDTSSYVDCFSDAMKRKVHNLTILHGPSAERSLSLGYFRAPFIGREI